MKQAFLTALMLIFIAFYTAGVFSAGAAVGGGLAVVKSINSTLNSVSKATNSVNKDLGTLQ